MNRNEKCWHWPIFPDRRQSSIFGSAQLNFCERNGNRWTLCDKSTNFFVLYSFLKCKTLLRGYPKSVLEHLCWHWPIFPDRRQSSIFGSAQLNFCERNGNRWTLCDKNTNLFRGSAAFFSLSAGAPPETRTPDPLIKSQLLYQLS